MPSSINREDGLWILIVGLLLVALWLPHLYYAVQLWRQHRSSRTFRNAFIAAMLVVSLFRGVLAGAARLWPGTEWVQVANRAITTIIFLLLITGALLSWWTWRHQQPEI
jgi:hypothetical protein